MTQQGILVGIIFLAGVITGILAEDWRLRQKKKDRDGS